MFAEDESYNKSEKRGKEVLREREREVKFVGKDEGVMTEL